MRAIFLRSNPNGDREDDRHGLAPHALPNRAENMRSDGYDIRSIETKCPTVLGTLAGVDENASDKN